MSEVPTKLELSPLRFIPFRKADILEMCLQDGLLAEQESDFRQLYFVLSNTFHFEFHQVIENLKNAYAPMDPDLDTRVLDDSAFNESLFSEQLQGLLDKANYEAISQQDLQQALNKSSLFKIRLHVDFDEFSDVLVFCRGESIKKATVKTWFGLSSKEIEHVNYERVVLYLRLKDQPELKGDMQSSCDSEATLLRLFQNVPKADIEMLFPNTQVRMRLIDKLFIGVPAVISGGVVLTTKLGASLVLLASMIGFWLGFSSQAVELNETALMALLAGLVAFGGYLWKQFNNFKNRKLRFMQALTQNLYFKNLDNNAGVIHRLVNDAEEEEVKEALLAYYFLLVANKALSAKELDRLIEEWFASKWNCTINFEIDDALQKLLKLGIVEFNDNRYTALSLESSLKKLDKQWDNYINP